MKVSQNLAPVALGAWFAWIVLALLGALVFQISKDVAFKRAWYPRYVIGTGVLFGGVIVLMSGPNAFSLLIGLPMIALITYLNVRLTRFCPGCGRTIYPGGFSRPRYCPRCGTLLG